MFACHCTRRLTTAGGAVESHTNSFVFAPSRLTTAGGAVGSQPKTVFMFAIGPAVGSRRPALPLDSKRKHVCSCLSLSHRGSRRPTLPLGSKKEKHGHQPPVCREHMGLGPTCSRRPTLAWGVVSRQCPSPGAQDVVPPDQRGGLGRRPKVPTASDWPVGCRGNMGLGPTCSRRPTGLGPSCSRRPTAYKLLH